MLNYYHLLKISDLCNDAEVITMAYRRAIAEKAHGNESDDGFRERICCVTEAYLVLSDMLLKNRYDHALSEGTPLDDDLSQHIAAKRSEAEAFVLARLGARGSRLPESYRSKRRHHKSLIGIAIGVIVLLVTVFGHVIRRSMIWAGSKPHPRGKKFPSRMPKSKCRPKWS